MKKQLLFTSFVLLLVSHAFAADKYWDVDGATGGLQPGPGVWDTGTTALWSTTSAGTALTTWTDDDSAFFRTGGANSVTLSGTILANSVTQSIAATATSLNSGTLQIQSNTGIVNSGTATLTVSSAVMLNSGDVSLNAGAAISLSGAIGEIGESRGITKSGAAIVTFSGSAANTYTGITNVTDGQLTLSKSSGVTAIAGDLNLTSARLRLMNSQQMATTTNVTMSGSTSVFNGTSINTNQGNFAQTFGSLTVSGGAINSGTGALTISGAGSITGGAENTMYIGNSGSNVSFGSLSVTGMTATAGDTIATANSFTIYGNNTSARSRVVIGSGGLNLNGSVINLRRGSLSGADGSRLILNGDITTAGTTASRISEDTAGGTVGAISVDLSSTAGTFNRTINVAGGGADLTISVPVVNGAATTAGIIKTGLGTLTLSGVNTYNGTTAVNAGILLVNGSTGSGTVNVDNGGTLGGTGAISGNVNVAAGGILLAGDGVTANEDLTLSGNVALADDSIIKLTLGAGGTHSRLTRGGGTWTFDSAQAFTFEDAGTVLGAYDNIITGLAEDPGTLGAWTITNAGYSGVFTYDAGTIDLVLVPEPATTSCLLVGIALLVGGKRFRRGAKLV